MLLLLNEKLKKLQEDNSDLLEEKNEIQLKLLEFENKATIDAQNVQALEKSLKIAKSELDKFNENQLSNIAVNNLKAQLSNDAFAREIDILTFQLNEKQKEFEYCETEKKQMEVNYNSEISKLEQLLQLEKLKFIEKRYCQSHTNTANRLIRLKLNFVSPLGFSIIVFHVESVRKYSTASLF